MRVVAALVLVVVNIALGWSAGAGPALADEYPPPISDCFTVSISPPPPVALRPTITVCQA